MTEAYRRHEECFDDETRSRLREDPDVFGFSGLTYTASPQESRALNDRPGPFVVISASGMCEAGRVLHHLRHSVEDPRNALLIVGFQAPDTLGRRIVEKQPRLRIMDDWFDLRAEVLALDGFSAHADREDFRRWFEGTGGEIGHAFVVHGEGAALPALSELLQPFVRSPVRIPKLHETADV
jgi:metallo-beta-lactamase family protein